MTYSGATAMALARAGGKVGASSTALIVRRLGTLIFSSVPSEAMEPLFSGEPIVLARLE